MALGISARVVHTAVVMLAGLALSRCFSAVSLNKVVVAYDEAVTDALSKQLLINIASVVARGLRICVLYAVICRRLQSRS